MAIKGVLVQLCVPNDRDAFVECMTRMSASEHRQLPESAMETSYDLHWSVCFLHNRDSSKMKDFSTNRLTSRMIAGLIPCAILFFGLFFIPESPRWLAKIGREKEFEAALQDLRGKDADISKEAAEIRDYIETLKQLLKTKMLDLFQQRHLRSVIVVITSLITPMIDRSGRKPLLLVSSTGLVLGCVLSGISFYLKDHNSALDAVPVLAVFVSAFSSEVTEKKYIPYKYQMSSRKPRDAGELVWCMGSFLHFQIPYELKLPWYLHSLCCGQCDGYIVCSQIGT
ncbi:Receptor-like kinase in in flowers 3 [Hibiscus syriacus]|uniref:Receptor-like kinase in in flowers 3 n=1 Tax=Hibiscus syriacus TaxID=106335 RepID=A0A6A2WVZ2_HIBSY|nr:Receptor-like kinase in in flowers 3 [Hibiscus syriacus]